MVLNDGGEVVIGRATSEGFHPEAPAKGLGVDIAPASHADGNLPAATKSKLSFALSAVVVSVTADDKDNPKSLAATVSIEVIFHGDPLQSFKATGNGKMSGTNAKRL